MNNPLIKIIIEEDGNTTYQMVTFDIEVVARLTGGIAPTISYMYNDNDVTDDIRAIRFHHDNPASYIEDYASFQQMLYEKEQRAINELYETLTIKPKNMSTAKQLLWSFFLLFLVMLPVFVVMLIN
ncbi:MAG: sodium:proton antiporter [Solibacillus sp.]|uniref:sodium:proton antiporter n=1 Tax=Solibacillus sp. TaxID=1909654 RepID=UPI0033158C3E